MSIAEKLTTIAENQQKVYDKGRQSGNKEVWGALQNYGNPHTYYYAFCYDRLDDSSYNPQYDIVCANTNTAAMSIFYSNKSITDTKVPIYVYKNAQAIFCDAANLKRIALLIPTQDTTWNNAFSGAYALEDITMGGTIGQNISFSACTKLTHDSLMSIIEHLGKVSATRTLTLGSTNLAKLTDAEKAIATEKGWTLA